MLDGLTVRFNECNQLIVTIIAYWESLVHITFPLCCKCTGWNFEEVERVETAPSWYQMMTWHLAAVKALSYSYTLYIRTVVGLTIVRVSFHFGPTVFSGVKRVISAASSRLYLPLKTFLLVTVSRILFPRTDTLVEDKTRINLPCRHTSLIGC